MWVVLDFGEAVLATSEHVVHCAQRPFGDS